MLWSRYGDLPKRRITRSCSNRPSRFRYYRRLTQFENTQKCQEFSECIKKLAESKSQSSVQACDSPKVTEVNNQQNKELAVVSPARSESKTVVVNTQNITTNETVTNSHGEPTNATE